MKPIIVEERGDASNLKLADLPDPAIGDSDLRAKVHATALNRADTLQRMAHYPAPQGASEVLGLDRSCRPLLSAVTYVILQS